MMRFLSIAVLVFYAFSLPAQKDIPDRPSPPHLVNNLSLQFPDFITADETGMLERKLDDFANQTSNQVAIVIVDSLNGYEVHDFGVQLFNKWGIGQKKEGNGILLLIKPTGGPGGRDARIITGYGLEGAIPDLVAKRIIEEELIPDFKKGNYYSGIDKAVDKIMGFAKGEYDSSEYSNTDNGFGRELKYALVAIVIIIIISYLFRGGGGGMTMTRYGRTYWGGGFGGGSFGGGFGGGGFGGFGGGSSGGGGAGGKW